MNALAELTTLEALPATVAICPAEGFDGSAFTELTSLSTDDLSALVSFGKSLLAELTSAVASLWIFFSCDSRPLIPLLTLRFVRPLTEFSRLARVEQ